MYERPHLRDVYRTKDTKKRIFVAALEMFFQSGCAGTNIRELAAAPDIGKPSLYRHFEGKEEIGNMEACEKPAAIAANNPETVWNLKGYAFIPLRECPQLLERAAKWFHEKWGVPESAYLACMTAYLNRETEYGWYLCLREERIIGGLGVIENDFHDRKDLAPNVCAVYTEEDCRGQGVAGRLLELAVEDMRAKGITPLYLVTDHTGFYERYGWEFLCMAHEDGSANETRVYIHR